MKQFRNLGFAGVETLLLLVFLAVIGFTGYYVWHSGDVADKSFAAQQKASSATSNGYETSGLVLSKSPTFYDCLENNDSHRSPLTHEPVDGSHYNYDSKTGICTLNAKVYTYPTHYSDDMIRGVSKYRINKSEGAQLRSVAQKNFTACRPQPGGYDVVATISIYGEAQGKFLYYGVGCDSGHREIAKLISGQWQQIYSSQDVMDCATVRQYEVPPSLLSVKGEAPVCYDSTAHKEIDL